MMSVGRLRPRDDTPPERSREINRFQLVKVMNGVAIGGIAVAMALTVRQNTRCIRMRDWSPDSTAIRALQASGATGKLAVWFDYGEYAIWHLSPHVRVSLDGRRETVYSEAALQEQRALSRGDAEGLSFIVRTRPEYLWFPSSNGRLKSSLAAMGYRLDIDNARTFLAVRADLPAVTGLRDAPVTNCFPGP
jgi:hypothetical protein